MKNNVSVLRLILVSAWLISSLACGSGNQTSANSSNPSVSNANSNDRAAAVNKRDPKIVCDYHPGSLKTEYKELTATTYYCTSKSFETLSSGKIATISYSTGGDSQVVDYVYLYVKSSSQDQDAAETDELLAKASDALWQKVFAAPLPAEFKEAILADKGKNTASEKEFTVPTKVSIRRTPEKGTMYHLKFQFELPK